MRLTRKRARKARLRKSRTFLLKTSRKSRRRVGMRKHITRRRRTRGGDDNPGVVHKPLPYLPEQTPEEIAILIREYSALTHEEQNLLNDSKNNTLNEINAIPPLLVNALTTIKHGVLSDDTISKFTDIRDKLNSPTIAINSLCFKNTTKNILISLMNYLHNIVSNIFKLYNKQFELEQKIKTNNKDTSIRYLTRMYNNFKLENKLIAMREEVILATITGLAVQYGIIDKPKIQRLIKATCYQV